MHVGSHQSSTHFGFERRFGTIRPHAVLCCSVAVAMTDTLSIISLAATYVYIFALFGGMSELILSMKRCIESDNTVYYVWYL